MSEANQNERVVKPDFPICQTGKKIPWSIAERAYEGYVKRYGKCQTLERIAERGGFYVEEMDQLYPSWREEVEEVHLLRKQLDELQRENAELSQNVCSECSPDNYGWIFNRVEGKAACGCMTEAEPFQILLKALEQIAKFPDDDPMVAYKLPLEDRMKKIATDALKSVLPLDYSESV